MRSAFRVNNLTSSKKEELISSHPRRDVRLKLYTTSQVSEIIARYAAKERTTVSEIGHRALLLQLYDQPQCEADRNIASYYIAKLAREEDVVHVHAIEANLKKVESLINIVDELRSINGVSNLFIIKRIIDPAIYAFAFIANHDTSEWLSNILKSKRSELGGDFVPYVSTMSDYKPATYEIDRDDLVNVLLRAGSKRDFQLTVWTFPAVSMRARECAAVQRSTVSLFVHKALINWIRVDNSRKCYSGIVRSTIEKTEVDSNLSSIELDYAFIKLIFIGLKRSCNHAKMRGATGEFIASNLIDPYINHLNKKGVGEEYECALVKLQELRNYYLEPPGST